MSASAEGLVQRFGLKVDTPASAGISSESRKAKPSKAGYENTGFLIGAASLYVFVVTSLLWSAPAWMVVAAPFLQAGVAESLHCHFAGSKELDS